MPFLIQRFELLGRVRKDGIPDKGLIPTLASQHYDCAISHNPYAMGPLKRLVSAARIVFGSDYPFRHAKDHVDGLEGCDFTEAELAGIHRGNIEKLLPRLKS